MRSDIKAIAWDFDGVLNRNVVDGRFIWSDHLEADLGIPLEQFQSEVFDNAFLEVINGRIDLLDHLNRWLETTDHKTLPTDLMTYWFKKDDLRDPLTFSILETLYDAGVQQAIATNNEGHRATYIEHVSGYGAHVSHVFSSGRIGAAKPDAIFFDHVIQTLKLAPKHVLLIDDSIRNVRAAKELGWNAFHFTDNTREELATFLGL